MWKFCGQSVLLACEFFSCKPSKLLVTPFSLLNPISLKFFEIAGSYAEYSVVPVEKLVKVPSNISFEQAATSMIQGLTAHYLTHTCYPVGPGTKVLVHAAAGGTGSLICQVAKNVGNDNRKIIEQSFLNVTCKGVWWFRGEGCTRVQLWWSYWSWRVKRTEKIKAGINVWTERGVAFYCKIPDLTDSRLTFKFWKTAVHVLGLSHPAVPQVHSQNIWDEKMPMVFSFKGSLFGTTAINTNFSAL